MAHFHSLADKEKTLLSIIDTNDLLLAELCDYMHVSKEQEIKAEPTSYGRNRRLLNWVRQSSAKGFDAFISSLRLNGQAHVANFIIGTPGEMPLRDDVRERLRRIKGTLINIMYTNIGLLANLIGEEVISDADSQNIEAETTLNQKNAKLVEIIMRGSERNLQCFKDVLTLVGQGHVVTYMERGEVLPIHIQFTDEKASPEREESILAKLRKFVSVMPENWIDEIMPVELSDDQRTILVDSVRNLRAVIVGAHLTQSIMVYVYCSTLSVLESVWTLFQSAQLNDILETICQCLSNDDTCTVVVSVSQEDYVPCKKELSSSAETNEAADRVGWKSLLDELDKSFSRPGGGDLWGNVRRQDRPGWSEWLDEARRLVLELPASPPMQQDIVDALLSGAVDNVDETKIPNAKNKVVAFICSTFTDFKTERNALIIDVYPFLRLLCRTLGLEFDVVDMRWGVSDTTTREHGTTNMCLREVRRCLATSAGPAFVCMLGNKYGFRPLPTEIDQPEFEKLLSTVEGNVDPASNPNPTTLLRKYYQLDLNAVPPNYVLKAYADDATWSRDSTIMQTELRKAAVKTLPDAEAEKYRISVIESEIRKGIFENEARSNQVILVDRHLAGVTSPPSRNHHLVDACNICSTIDIDAQQCLLVLKTDKIKSAGLWKDHRFAVVYTDRNLEAVRQYVRQLCDELCLRLTNAIFDGYRRTRNSNGANSQPPDVVLEEVLRHRALIRDRQAMFVGRKQIRSTLAYYFRFDGDGGDAGMPKRDRVAVVHGTSGCGKTAIVAVAASKLAASTTSTFKPVVVVRFLGTSLASSTARSLMYSVCSQLIRIYRDQQNDLIASQVPESYKQLVVHFRRCLFELPSSEQPLVVIFDSLDQLSNEDFGRDLRWLPLADQLPPFVRVLVSTLPAGQPHVVIQALSPKLPVSNLIAVGPLDSKLDGPQLLDQILHRAGRTLSEEQRRIVLDLFAKCALPLYIKLAADVAIRWRSYDVIRADDENAIPADITGLVEQMFDRLESRYGRTLVGRALGYLSASKNGLAVGELEDILSCDDAVLDEVYAYWVPPIRRLPPLLWIRIRDDLGPYLVERGTDGVAAYAWYHRQFWMTARRRYLAAGANGFKTEAHQAIADYFDGRWLAGKPRRVAVKGGQPNSGNVVVDDRHLPDQPIIFDGLDRSSNSQMAGSESTSQKGAADNKENDGVVRRMLNRRKLRELPFHLVQLRNWDRFAAVCCTLEWVEARFEAGQGYDCLAEFQVASRWQPDNKRIKTWTKFIGAYLAHIVRRPSAIYQLAFQQVWSNPVRRQIADTTVPPSVKFVIDSVPEVVEDPCELTLLGHRSGVRCCSYSPDGSLIASTAEDGSLRVWDTGSGLVNMAETSGSEAEVNGGGGVGAERLVVAGLPGPLYPALADPYHGERPCCFSVDGRHVATGSEDGWIQVWDLTGAQVFSEESNTGAVTCLKYSFDGTRLAAASKDCTVTVYGLPQYQQLARISVVGPAMCCDWSPDDSRLCVALGGGVAGMALINTGNYSVISQEKGYIELNICCAYSPRSDQVATGGTDSCVTLWDAARGRAVNRMTGHKGWIWGIIYTPDGSRLISGSSDRSIKIWDMSTNQCIVSLGGHLHRVCWISLHCGSSGGNKMVTSSLDCALKIWDLDAVLAPDQQVPAVGGLHYVALRATSVDVGDSKRQYVIAANQGWGRSCQLSATTVAGNEQQATAWNTASWKVIGQATTHDGFVDTVAFTADSSRIVTIDTGHGGQYTTGAVMKAQAKVSSVSDGALQCILPALAPCSVACSQQLIFIGTADRATVHVFDADEYHLICSWSFNDAGSAVNHSQVTSVSYSLTSNDIAVAVGSSVKIWRLGESTSGALEFITELPLLPSTIKRVLYSPDGATLIATAISGSVQMWQTADRYASAENLVGHVSSISDAAFSADSRYLATAAVEMSVFVWEIARRRLKAAWYGPVSCLDFLSNDVIVVGEATGNRRCLKIEE